MLLIIGCSTHYTSHMKECREIYTGLEETVTCAKESRYEYCRQSSCGIDGNKFYDAADAIVAMVHDGQMSESQGKQLLDDLYQIKRDERNQALGMIMMSASDALAGRQPSYGNSNQDYDWDWDGFYDQYGNMTWRCRGIQTGRFAEDWRCASDLKTDNRWPGK